jgi:hypothetical protein
MEPLAGVCSGLAANTFSRVSGL